jgi:arylformamidase
MPRTLVILRIGCAVVIACIPTHAAEGKTGDKRGPYLNAALKLSEEEIKSLSPLRLPGVNKRLAIAYGTAELPALVRNSREYHARRAQSSGSVNPGSQC